MNSVVLASTSVYRKALIEKLGLPFEALKPTFDEDQFKKENPNLPPIELAEKLSQLKGKSLIDSSESYNHKTVISGDQLVSFKNFVLGKSHTKQKAIEQLQQLRHQTHQLITATTVFHQGKIFHLNHITTLKMKNLSDSEIINYVDLDQPIDCAGSYKIEKSGIALFESIECSDFTAIQGLPLIWLSTTLKGLGYELFQKRHD